MIPNDIRNWLNERGISDAVADRAKLRWEDKLVIPIYGMHDEFRFNKYRRHPSDPALPRYWSDGGSKPELYGWRHIRDGSSPLIICEGELDRLSLESHGLAAITATHGAGSLRSEWLTLIPEDVEVYLCFDNDGAGLQAAAIAMTSLPRSKLMLLPVKDVGEFFKAGHLAEHFIELMRGAAPYLSVVTGAREQNITQLVMLYHQVEETYRTKNEPLRRFLSILIERYRQSLEQVGYWQRTATAHSYGISLTDIERARGIPLAKILNVSSVMIHCPFHKERTPSFHLTGSLWFCHGACRRGGDSIDLVMRLKELSFQEAVSYLNHL